jgi:hypothetical protein
MAGKTRAIAKARVKIKRFRDLFDAFLMVVSFSGGGTPAGESASIIGGF